ncbi:MAG: glutaredoxin family protein [Bacilli bacterium]
MLFYTRKGCCLCDNAKVFLKPLAEKYNIVWEEIDIEGNMALTERYGLEIPVCIVADEVLLRGILHKDFIINRLQDLFGY